MNSEAIGDNAQVLDLCAFAVIRVVRVFWQRDRIYLLSELCQRFLPGQTAGKAQPALAPKQAAPMQTCAALGAEQRVFP